MKTSNPTKYSPLTITFDRYIDESFYLEPCNCMKIDIGWLDITVGKDDHNNEIVMAYSRDSRNSFTYGFASLPLHNGYRRKDSRQWVYSMQYIPKDYLLGKTPATRLAHGDFCVYYGLDSQRRQFLYVVLTLGIVLLFRNPNSRAALPWSPAGAIELKDYIEPCCDQGFPMVEQPANDSESKGDADLDVLLAKFG